LLCHNNIASEVQYLLNITLHHRSFSHFKSVSAESFSTIKAQAKLASGHTISIRKGDLTKENTEAIVNAGINLRKIIEYYNWKRRSLYMDT
jgi:hypothetical protein